MMRSQMFCHLVLLLVGGLILLEQHVLADSVVSSIGAVFEKRKSAMVGRICAFGDFNWDRYTDVVVDDAGTLKIYAQRRDFGFEGDLVEEPMFELSMGNRGYSCAVGDFDGDMNLDLLVATPENGYFTVAVYLLQMKHLDDKTASLKKKINKFDDYKFFDEPLVVDVNADGHDDVLGHTTNGEFMCFLGGGKTNDPFDHRCEAFFVNMNSTSHFKPFKGMPHMMMGFGEGLNPNIVFSANESGQLSLKRWKRQEDDDTNSKWVEVDKDEAIPALGELKFVAAPFQGDFNADTKLEIVVPQCQDEDCKVVTFFHVYQEDRVAWQVLDSSKLQEFEIRKDRSSSRVIFRPGDFDQDGYPDLLVTASLKKDGKTTAFYATVLKNSGCDSCGEFGRKFEPRLDYRFIEPTDMIVAPDTKNLCAFIDLKEDGSLDIVCDFEYDGKTRFDFIEWPVKEDTTFLKAQTFTNLCSTRCREESSEVGSGIPWATACLKYRMTGLPGVSGQQQGAACQLPQTSHRSLGTPFVLFGLGRSPSFVDELQVSGPMQPSDRMHYTQKQLIPNSRLILIPPAKNGSGWQSRLYLTPSQLIIQSLIILSTVCLLLGIVVLCLHWREKREDRHERQAQSHRFHFDAM